MGTHRKRKCVSGSRRGAAIAMALCLAAGAWSQAAAPAAFRPSGGEVAAVIRRAIERDKILDLAPGLGVVVVRGGETIYLEGFGLADAGSGRRVDAEKTRFRIGSITKVFTAMEALALAERGKLALEDDIASYLPEFRRDRPIRIEDLLTHSAGFDETILGYTPASPGGAGLADYLRVYRPALIREPGLVSQYSNYGLALAGAIEAKASGRPYEDCVAEDILKPLGMLSSGFAPSPDTAAGHVAKASGFAPVAYGAIADTPDGGLEATCADMGRFLAALMEGPEKGSAALSAASHGELLRPRFRNPGAPTGVALCIQEEVRGGRRFLEHQGGLPEGHVSYLAIYPEAGLGIFVGANALSPAAARVIEAFESMLPMPRQEAMAEPPAVRPDPAAYVGSYRCNQFAHESFQKIFTIAAPELISISASPEGRLIFSSEVTSDRPGTSPLIHVGGDSFEREDGGGPVCFLRDRQDRISALSTSSPIYQFERIGILDEPSTGAGIALGCMLAFALLAIIGFARRKARGVAAGILGPACRATALISGLDIIASAALLAAAGVALNGSRLPAAIALGALTLLSTAGLALTPLALTLVAKRQGKVSERLYVIAGALASIVWFGFLLAYNLYGIRL